MDEEQLKNDTYFLQYLEELMPASKRKKMAEVLQQRTYYICTVIENVLDSNNTNAILRTSEALGIQHAHLVYGSIKYVPQKSVSKGAHLWMNMHTYNHPKNDNVHICISHLKKQGYALVVTSPKADKLISDLPFDKPLAVCFGQESKGISDAFVKEADYLVKIPQYGFTESYNVAVAAGMVLLPLMEKLRNSAIDWRLSAAQQSELHTDWVFNYFPKVKAHYAHYLSLKEKGI